MKPSDPLTLFFFIGAIVSVSLVIWSYTPKGKDWIKHLDD